MTRPVARPVEYTGAGGLTLRGEEIGDPSAPPVLLLHGGGQTRHSWSDTAVSLNEDGWRVVNLDQRGHGDSDWAPGRQYAFADYAEDVRRVVPALGQPPVLVGASLGGLASLLAESLSEPPFSRGLVLVDVATRMEPDGVTRILDFMRSHPDGFETLEECADAVAAYNPHRPRPKDPRGLERNLRRGEDGRWRWHWDPGFVGIDRRTAERDFQIHAAARALRVPTLLVRGKLSDLLSEEGAREFLTLVPHARFVDVSGAGHMVAGDNNDVFTEAVRRFLRTEIGLP
ncbi:MAG: alpha/beta hydrolase [Deltaproteobacteria bacterium]|nr:alpha/beta hydrolase [Deltaproteobacteria bacterium]